MRGHLFLAVLGAALLLLGGGLAHKVQTAGGIQIEDVGIPVSDGNVLGGYLYIPPNATPQTPAPAVLAVHGYINSRETQSAFAIELSRRGYVVLAIDQSGHGMSTNVAFADGFGGPAGLMYLQSLDFVDASRIGLEGHSMGGWTSLAAAITFKDAYRSVALVGSSTGAPYAAPGTPEWPRNLAVVFTTFDEFGPLMWGVEKSAKVAQSEKLQAVFGVTEPVEPGRIYGSIEEGTARRLTQPVTTHPGAHLSFAATADVIDWMDETLGQPKGPGPDDQIWQWKEVGTFVALTGGVFLLIGSFGAVASVFGTATDRSTSIAPVRGAGRWVRLGAAIAVPALTYFPLTTLGARFAGNAVFSQNITTQIVAWALGNGAFALIGLLLRRRFAVSFPIGGVIAAVVAVAVLFVGVVISDVLFQTDLRFWVVALKPMGTHHWPAFFAYLLPFIAFFYFSHAAMAHSLINGARVPQLTAWLASAGGMTALIAGLYAYLFVVGKLPGFANPLFSIVGIQFVPILTITGILAAISYRRTGAAFPGALASGLFVTWYVVAGQATHA